MNDAPDFLISPRARACYGRIVSSLQARGIWDETFAMSTAVAAGAAASYIANASHLGQTESVEGLRMEVRLLLADLLMVTNAHIAEFTAEGLDADIVRLCAIRE